MTHSTKQDGVLFSTFEQEQASYWDNKQDDKVNLLLGEADGLYHHHYGIGDYDSNVLSAPSDQRDAEIVRELHRLENRQTELILEALGDVKSTDRVLDAGSGRGGTSFMINEWFGCQVDGVNISKYQIDFSTRLAEIRGCSDKVKFHYRNMIATGFPSGTFSRVVSNETTMYMDPFKGFEEFSRILQPGGKYVIFTWCYNDVLSLPRDNARVIDDHYKSRMNSRSTYFKALAANDLVPYKVVDLTEEAIPYWDLRTYFSYSTGIEKTFLDAYREYSMNFLLIAADRM